MSGRPLGNVNLELQEQVNVESIGSHQLGLVYEAVGPHLSVTHFTTMD